MTLAEVFDKLGFSPIIQAIAGFAWFTVLLYTMVLAERNKKKIDAAVPTPPPSSIPVPDHLANLAALLKELTEIGRTGIKSQDMLCAKFASLQQSVNQLGGKMDTIAKGREGQIDELITAIKEVGKEIRAAAPLPKHPSQQSWWWR